MAGTLCRLHCQLWNPAHHARFRVELAQRLRARGVFNCAGGYCQAGLDWTCRDSTSPRGPAVQPRFSPPPLLSRRPHLRVECLATCHASRHNRHGLSATAAGRAGEWRFASDWSSQAIGAALPRDASARGTIAARAAPGGWSDLSLTDDEIRVGIALDAGEGEQRSRDRRRKARRARDEGDLFAGLGGDAEGFGAAGDGEADGGFAVEGPTRGVRGKGRNAAKRSARKAKDYGVALVELKRKEVQRVVSWMDLPEGTLEAVQLAQTITRRGKNGWRRQLSYIGT
ncbi:hypothetical protein CLOP_g11450 [Closterium sp. NIES-67]|nr:hypothetical protein CLOP_g11450 [Closterium sp. NIES-67]